MKKVFYLFLLLPGIVFSQIQVSDIDYQLPRDDYHRKGFVKVGTDEYFIEQGVEGTKVSLVKEDQLEFIHELKHRPTDSQLNIYAYSYENSNSGLIYDGSTLYELYWNYIYAVDIVSGELLEVIDLNAYDIRLQQRFYHGDNYFLFIALADVSGYYRLDRNTGLLDYLENGGPVVDSKQYWISDDGNKLNYYDLEANQSLEHPHPFFNIESITSHDSDSNTRLIIKDENGTHLLRDDETIQTISCDMPAGSQLSYVSDSRLAYTRHTGTELVFSVIDLEICTEVYSKEFIDNSGSLSLSIYSDAQLFDEYFFFGFPNDWQGDGLFHLYDIAANEARLIELPIDFPLLNRAVRYENSLYFLTYNHLHYIGSLPELYRIDLGNYKTERISKQNIYETFNIVIGEPQDDKELNVFYQLKETSSLQQIDAQQQSLVKVEDFDLFKNHGIHYGIYADLWAGNKYFFSTSNAIFVMENDVTTKVLDIGPNAHGSSAYKRLGDYVYVLTGLEDGHYALKINIDDLSYSKILLPGVEYLFFRRATSENAIVNLDHSISFDGSAGFFDLDSEEFTSFEDLGLPVGTPEFLSGNNIIYQTSSSNGYKWYLVNTLTKEVTLTEIESGTFPDPYPDGEGGFYLDGWAYSDKVSFMHVDGQGKLTEIYEDFDYPVFYGGDRFEGQVKSLAFDGPENLIVVSTKDGEVRQKMIPDNGSVYYQTFFWYESDQVSFLQTSNGVSYDTYTFTFDSEPVNITPSGRDDRLLSVIEGETHVILVYKNDQNILSFEKYEYASGDMEQVAELQSVRNGSIGSDPLKLEGSKYLLNVNDAVHGSEPYIYDMATDELQILKDTRQGIGSSNISDYTINPLSKEVYFSAIKTEGDRQLFRLNQGVISTQDLNVISVSEVQIYPSPATTHIRLGKDYENVFIIGIDGKLVAHMDSYTKDDQIRVEGLIDGMYLIQARAKNNQVETGKFMVKRQ